MNRQPSPVSLSSVLRASFAGAICIGAVFGLAALPGFRQEPDVEKTAEPPRIELKAATPALAVYSYYPEQLAALQSLSRFQPIADAGVKPALAPVEAAIAPKTSGPEIRPVRRSDSPLKLPAVAAANPASAAPAPAESPKIFGLPLGGAAEIGGRMAGMRDTAANWGQAAVGALGAGSQAAIGLGAKIASFWR